MLSRFEYNIQTHEQVEIFQRVFKNKKGETIVLDDGEKPPKGFSEFTGEIKPELPEEAE